MGFDMQWLCRPNGLEDRLHDISSAMSAVRALREAIPTDERGTYTREEQEGGSWFDPPANASDRYRAAQLALKHLVDLHIAEQIDGFQFNASGMHVIVTVMDRLGMVHRSSTPDFPPRPDFPERLDGAHFDEAVDFLREGGDPPEGVPASVMGAAAEYVEQVRCALKAHSAATPSTIPSHKFSDNSGWIITPTELQAALDVYDSTPISGNSALCDLGRLADSWPRWIAFLRGGIDHRGIGVHPATRCLLDPRYTHALARTPSVEVCADLIDWWTDEAPSLRYDVDTGPSSITGWLVGDLLSALSDQRRKGNALCQTPWWVADGILDRTLIPAAQEFVDETLRTIDPTCGTGHMVIRKIDYLWELYTTGTLHPRQATGGPVATGWTPIGPAEAAARILAGCHGVELDPLTAAVARLRYIVTLGHLLHRAGALPVLRLDALPPWRPPIVVGDSLLAGKATAEEYAALRPEQAAIVNLGEAS